MKTIEQQIIEKADQELQQAIDKLYQLVYNSIACVSSSPVAVEGEVSGTVVQVRPYIMYAALKKLAFDSAVERNRQNAVNAFMAKIDNVTEQLQDLQNQITT